MGKKEKTIRVLRFNASEPIARIEVIENDLSTLQGIVGGLIEVVTFGNVLCIINEEGKFNGSKPNIGIEIMENRYDVIMGDVLFVGDGGAEFRSLNKDELKEAVEFATKGRWIVDRFKEEGLISND